MKKVLKFSVVSVLILLLELMVFASITEDFEGYIDNTVAEDLSTPGVTFSGGGAFSIADTASLGFALDNNVLFSPGCTEPLTMSFSALQQSFSVDFAVADNPLRVSAYENGVLVAEQDFNGAVVSVFPQGNASLSATFDTVVLTAPSFSDCFAIDNLNTVAAPTVTEDGTVIPVRLDEKRINGFDAAAPIAVYPNGNDGIDIYTISDSEGTYAFSVNNLSDAACEGIIETQGNIIVARTSDCVYQINAPQYNGKTYVLRFDAPVTGSPYTSREDG